MPSVPNGIRARHRREPKPFGPRHHTVTAPQLTAWGTRATVFGMLLGTDYLDSPFNRERVAFRGRS